ncbi:hypothetical protein PV327_011440 [Microctonus hyperodae]|uniref:Uncharacterized protein n=1 Tax=Microctonus hyperodae TaxID=165561 RepID=A0AA39C356_MICHY|nr:hypothetical protein PV327_011440 [Microctonus hyperodae]
MLDPKNLNYGNFALLLSMIEDESSEYNYQVKNIDDKKKLTSTQNPNSVTGATKKSTTDSGDLVTTTEYSTTTVTESETEESTTTINNKFNINKNETKKNSNNSVENSGNKTEDFNKEKKLTSTLNPNLVTGTTEKSTTDSGNLVTTTEHEKSTTINNKFDINKNGTNKNLNNSTGHSGNKTVSVTTLQPDSELKNLSTTEIPKKINSEKEFTEKENFKSTTETSSINLNPVSPAENHDNKIEGHDSGVESGSSTQGNKVTPTTEQNHQTEVSGNGEINSVNNNQRPVLPILSSFRDVLRAKFRLLTAPVRVIGQLFRRN